MKRPIDFSNLTYWEDSILIGLFMILLWLPTLDSIFHFDRVIPRRENRNMAALPKPPSSGHEIQAYAGGLEAYFNDHFGCRKCFVQWNNKLKWLLFKESNDNRGPKVLVGKNGWLFMTDLNMLDNYTGVSQFTPEQLHNWQVLLEKNRDWLAQRGIAYVFVVAPDKHTIYPEELLDWVVKIRPQTKLDQFIAYMHKHSTVQVVDLREAVINAKKFHPTYKQTDTHWNGFGSFMAYQELLKTVAKQLPGLTSIPLESFTLTNQLEPGGDLARTLGISLTESNAISLIPRPEKLPVFTQNVVSNEDSVERKFTINPQASGRAIVFRDSFSTIWIQFLAYHFEKVTYLKQYGLDVNLIGNEKPALVITEMVERNFNVEDPIQIMAKQRLN